MSALERNDDSDRAWQRNLALALFGLMASIAIAIISAAVVYGELRESARHNAERIEQIHDELREIARAR